MERVPMVVSSRGLAVLCAALAAGLALVPLGRAAPSDISKLSDTVQPTLYVSYTMNCTFGITDDSGKPLTTVAPGSYQLQITTPVVFADVDLSGIYDMTACKSFVQFQLTGPGVNLTTTLQDGDEDYGLLDVTLQPGGTYTAVDLNQPSVARFVFNTASSGSPTAPTGPATPSGGKGSTSAGNPLGTKTSASSAGSPVPLRGTLDASVSSTGAPNLTFKGRSVTTLKAGKYTVAVVDKSKKSGFILQEIKKGASTLAGVPFVGKRSTTVDLTAGQWFFYPTFVGTKTYFIVTT
jgi:hypothetical protein